MASAWHFFTLKRINISQALLVLGCVWLFLFCLVKAFFVSEMADVLSISVESTGLILGVYGAVAARNQWITDRGNAQLERVVQGLRIYLEQYIEQLAILRVAGDQNADNFLKFKCGITNPHNHLVDILSDAYYLRSDEKQELYDLIFIPVQAKTVSDIEGYGDRLKVAIDNYQTLLRNETSSSSTKNRNTSNPLNKIIEGLLFACFTGLVSSALWAGYDQWRSTGDFLKQMEAEVTQNTALAREFTSRSDSEKDQTKYAPFYPSQLKTSVRDLFLPVYEGRLSDQTMVEVISFYTILDRQRDMISRVWQTAISGQTEVAVQMMSTIAKQQQEMLELEAKILSALKTERLKISFFCFGGKCLIKP